MCVWRGWGGEGRGVPWPSLDGIVTGGMVDGAAPDGCHCTLSRGAMLALHAPTSPAAPLEPPVAFEARLPPLQPKVSAKLTMLAAANGSLFAGPAVGGGLLHWGRPEGNMRRPTDVQEEAKQGSKVGRGGAGGAGQQGSPARAARAAAPGARPSCLAGAAPAPLVSFCWAAQGPVASMQAGIFPACTPCTPRV